MRRFWPQVLEISRKDLAVEIHANEVAAIIAPFGAVALMFLPLALGVAEPDSELLARIGGAIYWLVILVFGTLVTLRRSASGGQPQRDLMRMLGLDPAARFTASSLSTTVLLIAFQLILGPITLILYSPPTRGWGWLFLIGPLVALGLGMLGTIANGVTAGLASRTTLAALLVLPLSLPLLLGATQALEGLRLGEGILSWLALLVVTDLLLALGGVLTARPLEEAMG